MTAIKSSFIKVAMPMVMVFSMLFTLGVFPGVMAEANAATEVTRHHAIDTAGVTKVEIKNGVGAIYISPTDSETLSAEVFIEGSRSGLLRRKADVSGFDIEVERSGNTLKLTFGENNTKADWHIQLPLVDSLSVDLGVGHIDIEVLDTGVTVNNGVGDVTVQTALKYVGDVSVNTGVGNARISGAPGAESKRSIVSERSSAIGEGNKRINVEVGVGDAHVKLN